MEGQKVKDPTNPAYYKDGLTSMECIEAMELLFGPKATYDFCVCNAFKYIWRHRNKNGLEDLNKAQWYLDKAVEYNDNKLTDLLIRLQGLLNIKTEQWQESH